MSGRVRAAVLGVVLLAALGAWAPRAAASGPGVQYLATGSAEQVYVTAAPPHARLTLVNQHGKAVQTRRVDSLGGLLFRNVKPGHGYRVRDGSHRSRAVTVFSNRPAPPSTKFYSQHIPTSGYGYLRTRDGTKLAIDVRLPSGKGPYPTLIEYAGYGYADPAGAQSGISAVATLLGFAVVDVNMRGTGCSGGAFNYFEPLQSLDGYDVIETVAHQPWALHHKVGMLGISYGGISQLFVAATDPPDLAAITPLSVIDNTATTLYPGGILNTGFALGWAKDRVHDAEPASPTGGQAWAFERIQHGDQTCKHNQALHGEAANLLAMVRTNHYYVPKVANPLAPITFVHKIKVPVYLACQFTDEQTGGHCPDLAEHFTGTQRKWFTFTNGVHGDSLDPDTFTRWFDFMELFVAHQRPQLSPLLKAEAPVLFQKALGVNGVHLPADPIQSEPTYGAALAAFEKLRSVRILFDNGAGSSVAGNPVPAFDQSFSRLPLPGTRAVTWYLQTAGRMGARSAAGVDQFSWKRHAVPPTDFTGPDDGSPGGLWTAIPDYHWAQNPPGTAVSYLTAKLTSNTAVVGGGGVRLWIKASVPNVDLQATVTEVRPDGKETFVQDGWIRASERKLAPGSTLLYPNPTFRGADAKPLPSGRWTQLSIPLYYEGHVYRKGSRIRIIISAPNGAQPVWSFANTVPSHPATIRISHSAQRPSSLTLPVVPGVHVPTGLPPCPGLRGEPCRTYVPPATAH